MFFRPARCRLTVLQIRMQKPEDQARDMAAVAERAARTAPFHHRADPDRDCRFGFAVQAAALPGTAFAVREMGGFIALESSQ